MTRSDNVPRNPEPDARERVLIAYGEVMSIVQLWEQALAVIWWRTTRKQPARATGDFDTHRSQREIARLEAAFLRMTAQAVREAVTPHLGATAADNLSDLTSERNRLAHRFLRECGAEHGDFRAGTHDQLLAVGERFMQSLGAAMQVIEGFEPYRGPVGPHWEAIANRITDRLSAGRNVPRDPRLQ